MAEFHVTVVRKITTTLVVNAESAAAARRQIEDYGITESWSDHISINETAEEKIKSVRKADK